MQGQLNANLQTTALLATIALAGCGSVKTSFDHMRGIRHDSSPQFALNASQLPGYYVSTEPALFKFSEHTVETLRPNDGAFGCSVARPYHTDGNSIVVDAAPSCPAETLHVEAQTIGDSPGLALAGMAPGGYTKVDEAGAKESLFSFGLDGVVVPPDLKPLLPVEPSATAIDAARAAFRTAFTGARLRLKASVPPLVTTSGQDSPAGGFFLVDFPAGQAPAYLGFTGNPAKSLRARVARGGVACALWTSDGEATTLFNGFDLAVAQINVDHSRRQKGAWSLNELRLDKNAPADAPRLLRTPEEQETTNSGRYNTMWITFESPTLNLKEPTPALAEQLTLECTKMRGPDVLTLEDVKTALGTNIVITK